MSFLLMDDARLRATRATRGGLTSRTFLSKTHRSVYMLDRATRLPGGPCLLARGTRLGGVAFCHVNGSYHLLALSAIQNGSQSEEINVIDESQAENRPVPVQEAEIRWKKVSLVGR